MKKRKKEKKLPSITSRSRKHRLKIESEIVLQDGLQITTSKGRQSVGHKPIRATITISRGDMERLHSLILSHPNYFAEAMLSEFSSPAIEFMAKGARGKFKGKRDNLQWVKMEAGELYKLFSIITKRLTPAQYPAWVKRLKEKINALPQKDQFYHKGQLDLTVLTTFCIDKYRSTRGPSLAAIGLKTFEKMSKEGSVESFYFHHIKGHKPLLQYPKDITTSYLDSLSQEPPFRYIFKSLGLM